MLLAAVQASAGAEEVPKITDDCLPPSAGAAWRAGFEDAVTKMLQKTKRSMQRGLNGVAQGFLDLRAAAAPCGSSPALARLQESAERLRVLSTSRSLAHLDSKVKYEPLKALTVGDVDVHEELNAMIVAWQLRRGPDEIGRALAALLKRFASADAEPEEAAPSAASTTTPAPTPPSDGAGAVGEAKRTPVYWAEALNRALRRLGDNSDPVTATCVSEALAQRQAASLDAAFASMMEKTRRGMQKGLKSLAADVLALLDELTGSCGLFRQSPGAKRLRGAADRLAVLAAAKNLVNPGVNVDYEPLKALKVGGVDIHLELNRLIGAWIHGQPPGEVGDSLAVFFEDFKEEQEAEEKEEAPEPDADQPMLSMLRDAITDATSGEEPPKLGGHCFNPASTAKFVEGVEGAIEHMLQKRMKTMQQGLKELADATDRLLAAQPADCTASGGAKAIWRGAKKLQKVTRRTVVDYGTHIKYEAMKSLSVGGVAIHRELNNFLAAWKLRSQAESGTPFGELMRRLATVSGYDEL